MLNKLFKLHGRLTRAAGEAWLAETDYRLEHAGTADFDATLYAELNQRTDILIGACEEVMTAIKVINSVGDTCNVDIDKLRAVIEGCLRDAKNDEAEAQEILDRAYAIHEEGVGIDIHEAEGEAALKSVFINGLVTAYENVLEALEDSADE